MADFIALNEWSVPVKDGDFTEQLLAGGSRQRMFSGVMRDRRRYQNRSFDLTTSLMDPNEAKAVSKLLRGAGNRWTWEDGHYSDKGYGPEAGHNGTRTTNAGYGGDNQGLSISSGGTYRLKTVLDEPGWDGHWTVIAHFSTTSGSGFERLLWRDNDAAGAGYADGEAVTSYGIDSIHTYSATNGFDLLGTNLSAAADVTYWDNVVILPYRVTDEQAVIFSRVQNEFSALPYINVRLQSESWIYSALGEASTLSYVQASDSGTWTQDMQRIEAVISTVDKGASSTAPPEPGGAGFDAGFSSGFAI